MRSFLLAFLIAGSVFAQQDVHILHVRKNIYMLSGAGANIALSAGPDGVLMVDSGAAPMSDKILAAVRQLGLQLSTDGAPPSRSNTSSIRLPAPIIPAATRRSLKPDVPSQAVMWQAICAVLAKRIRRRALRSTLIKLFSTE